MIGKINIGYFGTKGLGNYGGFETIAFYLSKKIDKDFFRLYVSQEIDKAKNNKDFEIKNVNDNLFLINIKKSKINKFNHIDNMINEGKIINKCFKNNPWAINVIFQCGSTPGLTIKKKKERNKLLLLWNPDGIEWRRRKFKWYGRLVLYLTTKRGIKLSDAVTVDSIQIYKDLKKWLRNKLVYYLPSGAEVLREKDVSEEFLKEYKLKKYEYYILVGRAVPENHIFESIKWFIKSESNKKFLVVSNFNNDSYSKKVLKLIEGNGDKIIYNGPIYNQEKLKSLRYYAYAYLHGHSVGGTNPSLLEALGAGNPSICYDVPYNREVARDSGFYFNDFYSFKNALLKLEKDWKLRIEKSLRAIEIIKEDYLWDYIVELHEVVTMHSLAFYGHIEKKEYLEWLKTKKYYNKFMKRNFDNLEKVTLDSI